VKCPDKKYSYYPWYYLISNASTGSPRMAPLGFTPKGRPGKFVF